MNVLPHHRPGTTPRSSARRTLVLALLAPLLLQACARRPPLPDLAGPLAWVVVEASFAGEPEPVLPTGALLLDSMAFPRLGEAAGTGVIPPAELQRQLGRAVTLVDPMDVLECPPRQPCYVRGDASYLTIWEAERTRQGMELVVSRVYNVQGLYRRTTAVTHRLEVRPQAGGWRLVARDRLPT
jgi:hypothetical protein